MLSAKLVQMVENHWEEITANAIRQIRRDPNLPHVSQLSQQELKSWGEEIYKNLSHWLVESREEEVASYFERLGRARYEESTPLHETVLAVHLLKVAMLDYIRDHGFLDTTVEIYAEEELEHRVGQFFDSVIYHTVKGYESELRRAMDLVV